jgi:hypothetical protein
LAGRSNSSSSDADVAPLGDDEADELAALVPRSVSGVCYFGSAGRSAAQPALQLVEPGSLTVGTYGTVIPGILVGPGDKLGGLDGVLLTAFAKDHGLKLKLYQTTFASMILAVEQKKIDLGTYVFYTKERAQHPGYSASRSCNSPRVSRSNDVDLFPGVRSGHGLASVVNAQQGPNGRSAGTLTWAGLFNTYYWIDPQKHVTGVILTQILPFADVRAVRLYREFERGVYETLQS